mmetsp:Transcript_20294/g.14977  ORF Transcript_20294/g.14977 Transcript_20294/m.14977 type:complete len:159 (+) Transcript_20294:50-526(+)
MVYRKFVQPGRVAFVNFGKDYGKVVVIVDIADTKRVLVDGPTTGFPRVLYPVERLTLTKFKLPILRGARTGTVKKAALAAKINESWEGTAFAKKIALKKKRSSLTDLQRFKVMVLRKNRSFKLRKLAKKISGAGKGKGKAPAAKVKEAAAAAKGKGKK